jgi:proline racemase
MTAATAKDILNLGHHTVPPALQAVRVGPNRTPASARMAAATAKDTMQVGRTSVSRMRLIGARHGSRQEVEVVFLGVATMTAPRNRLRGCSFTGTKSRVVV